MDIISAFVPFFILDFLSDPLEIPDINKKKRDLDLQPFNATSVAALYIYILYGAESSLAWRGIGLGFPSPLDYK